MYKDPGMKPDSSTQSSAYMTHILRRLLTAKEDSSRPPPSLVLHEGSQSLRDAPNDDLSGDPIMWSNFLQYHIRGNLEQDDAEP